MDILTDEELAKLTEYKQKAKQIQHLRTQGIPFTVTRFGRPRVFREALKGLGLTQFERRPTEPNIKALEQRMRR